MSVKSVTEKAINYIKEDKVRSIILGLGSVMGIIAGVAVIVDSSGPETELYSLQLNGENNA